MPIAFTEVIVTRVAPRPGSEEEVPLERAVVTLLESTRDEAIWVCLQPNCCPRNLQLSPPKTIGVLLAAAMVRSVLFKSSYDPPVDRLLDEHEPLPHFTGSVAYPARIKAGFQFARGLSGSARDVCIDLRYLALHVTRNRPRLVDGTPCSCLMVSGLIHMAIHANHLLPHHVKNLVLITCDVLTANTINGTVSGGGGGATVDWDASPAITLAALHLSWLGVYLLIHLLTMSCVTLYSHPSPPLARWMVI
eukprot:tig00021128_g18885.t1